MAVGRSRASGIAVGQLKQHPCRDVGCTKKPFDGNDSTGISSRNIRPLWPTDHSITELMTTELHERKLYVVEITGECAGMVRSTKHLIVAIARSAEAS